MHPAASITNQQLSTRAHHAQNSEDMLNHRHGARNTTYIALQHMKLRGLPVGVIERVTISVQLSKKMRVAPFRTSQTLTREQKTRKEAHVTGSNRTRVGAAQSTINGHASSFLPLLAKARFSLALRICLVVLPSFSTFFMEKSKKSGQTIGSRCVPAKRDAAFVRPRQPFPSLPSVITLHEIVLCYLYLRKVSSRQATPGTFKLSQSQFVRLYAPILLVQLQRRSRLMPVARTFSTSVQAEGTQRQRSRDWPIDCFRLAEQVDNIAPHGPYRTLIHDRWQLKEARSLQYQRI